MLLAFWWMILDGIALGFGEKYVYPPSKSNRVGLYNIQTGDEFFLHDFDVRPRFKTKQQDRDFIEFEYYGYPTRRTPTFLHTTRRPIIRKPTTRKMKKPILTTRRKIMQNNKRRRVTTTKRPFNKKKQTNKLKFKKQQHCNRKRQRKMFVLPTFEEIKNSTTSLTNKFLNLFTTVQFDNYECSVISAFGKYRGVCYREDQCGKLGGLPVGNCESGYGVCCVFRRICGETSNQNLTYLEPPEDPAEPRNGDDSICSFWIEKTSPEIKQIRIDFLEFQLKGPDENGDCQEEKFVVSGERNVICGVNTGQHYYINADTFINPLQISISSKRKFQLLITQINTSCSTSNDCLQYYDGISGTISSFNYEMSQSSNPGYMNNLNYAICIKRHRGYCSITYETNVNEVEEETGFEIDSFSLNEQENESCPDDFIVLANSRICGDGFKTPITDYNPGPIVIPVRSDDRLTGRGFKLNFKQNKC